MSMNDFEKYISDYLDGELSSDNVKKLEEVVNTNMEFKKKFKDYKKMLDTLSNIDIKASSDFLNHVNEKVKQVDLVQSISPKTIFGYNYIAISGIAAAVGVFIFSISIFMSSESIPSFNMKHLCSKNVENKLDHSPSNVNLIAEDDTSNENNEIDLPKIHLVGGKR